VDNEASADLHSTIEDVYAAEAAKLWRALVAFAGDRELASDAVAEAFAQLIGRGIGVRDPAAWVWRAGFKIAGGELARARRPGPGVEFIPPAGQAADAVVDLMRALQQLPKRQRAVVVLHYLHDMSTPEVARHLGMATPTVRVHLTRGRKTLRTLLESNDD